jgi:hypothetical protein
MPRSALNRLLESGLSCEANRRVELAAVAVVVEDMHSGVVCSTRGLRESEWNYESAEESNGVGELAGLKEHDLGLISWLVCFQEGSQVQGLKMN